MVSIGGGSGVVARGSRSGRVSIGRRCRSMCVLLLLLLLPGVNVVHPKGGGLLSQTAVGGPLVGSGRGHAVIRTGAVSFRGHEIHKGVVGSRGWPGSGTRIGTGGV